MKDGRGRRALPGLAAGALLTGGLLGIFALGSLAGVSSITFTVFNWLTRVLPGSVVTFGLENTLHVLKSLGFNISNTGKAAERVLAIGSFFVAGAVVGLLFFVAFRPGRLRRTLLYGLVVGGVIGVFSGVVAYIQDRLGTITDRIGVLTWALVVFLLWGVGLALLHRRLYPVVETPAIEGGSDSVNAAPLAVEAVPSEPLTARAVSRRRFLVEMGGLVATIAVVGAGVGEVLAAQSGPKVQQSANAPIPFPNRNSPVKPVPGTRPEYTPVADHYTVDINFSPPNVGGSTWRLLIDGLVTKSLSLSLEQLKGGFKAVDRFATISCVSNPVGGDLIGTTLWTGVALRDVLALALPQSTANFVHMVSEDGFFETADLAMVEADERVMLTYAWNGQPLPAAHGFPLRILIPDVYGMKQPKWIKQLTVTATETPGYWVERGWDAKAEVLTTSVIDTVATDSVVMKGGRAYIPVGGIAYSGAKGISKVEVKVDEGPWEPAELRAPLSTITWVIWRYEWPFSPGEHVFYVRAYDGRGRLQVTEAHNSLPSGATGISAREATIPAKL